MTNKLKFTISIKDSKVINWDSFKNMFKEYMPKLNDWDYYLEIKKKRRIRSLMQNRYYHWVIVKKLSLHFDISSEEMHDNIKYLFLTKHAYSEVLGCEISITWSTTKLKTNEMEDFMNQVRQWALVEHGLYIELPHETEFTY